MVPLAVAEGTYIRFFLNLFGKTLTYPYLCPQRNDLYHEKVSLFGFFDAVIRSDECTG